MSTALNSPISYTLNLGGDKVDMNALIGREIRIQYSGQIHCVHCQKITKKSFSGGYCYPCSQKLAEADMCILKPETCHFSKGTCRDENWAQSHCMKPHYVYLSNSSGLKVGITRESQIPTRWIDQGAISAIPVFRVKDRLQSGLIEVLMKDYVSDKTNWRKMLTNDIEDIDLETARNGIVDSIEQELEAFDDVEFLEDDPIFLEYPVEVYPQKILSLSLEKTPTILGTLQGIKGQYLLLDTGVFNVRKHNGYSVEMDSSTENPS